MFFFHKRVVCFTTGRIWKLNTFEAKTSKKHQKMKSGKSLKKPSISHHDFGCTKMPFLLFSRVGETTTTGMRDFDKNFPREASHRRCRCHQMPRCGTRCWGSWLKSQFGAIFFPRIEIHPANGEVASSWCIGFFGNFRTEFWGVVLELSDI